MIGCLSDVVWMTRGGSRAEDLLSSGADGRVILWSLRRGLSGHVLLRLKRTASVCTLAHCFTSD
jgi:hypothetical protein